MWFKEKAEVNAKSITRKKSGGNLKLNVGSEKL